jgi:hypothetical protein
MTYVPFDATEEEIATREVLRPGVPSSMRKTLTSWIIREIGTERGYVYAHEFHVLENNLDLDFGLNPKFDGLIDPGDARGFLEALNGDQLLRVVDFTLFQKFRPSTQSLNAILEQGRSKWSVVERAGKGRLGERVPAGVQLAAENLMTETGAAGALLQSAWNKLYELHPDDPGAYAAAVKAVEAAGLSALGITQELATLTHVIRAIEAKGATWRLPFQREHTEYPSRDVLLALLKSLYRGQRDRHGSDAYTDVTHEEAEGAVLMAVTLVGWFARGLVAERDVEDFA